MARSDDVSVFDPRADERDALRREEGALSAFFDAAREEPWPAPSPAFLKAVLADAAAVAPGPMVVAPRPGLLARIGARLAPLGGWAGTTALAASAAIGFWAGAVGLGADYAMPTFWPDVATLESPADAIGGFFDFASLEG
jgi:hypothetical protein